MVALLAARQTAAPSPTEARVKSEVGLNSPPPPPPLVGSGHKSPSPAAAAATSPRGLAADNSGGGGEDFCCILCGLKEASVDKLKDHINMHFIGKVTNTNEQYSFHM